MEFVNPKISTYRKRPFQNRNFNDLLNLSGFGVKLYEADSSTCGGHSAPFFGCCRRARALSKWDS